MCGRPLRHGIFPCPIPGVGSSAFVCPACRRGALMVAAGLHGDARTGSISLLRARRRLESPPVFPIPSRRLFALALSSVFPASPAASTSVLIAQTDVEPRKNSFFISTFVPAAPTAARLPGGRGSSVDFLRRRDGPDHPRHPVRQHRRGQQHRQLPGQQRGQPRIVGSAPKRPSDDRDRSGDGQPPEVALPHLRDPAELGFLPVEHWRGTGPSQAGKSGPRSARRRERCLPATTFAIRCGTAATVGDRTVSNPIKPAQSRVSRKSSNIAAFRVDADVVARASTSPLRLDHVESKPTPRLFIFSNSLIAVENHRVRQGRNEHASSHPEIIGLEVSRHCLISIA